MRGIYAVRTVAVVGWIAMSIRLLPQSPLTTWRLEQIEALVKSSDQYPVDFDDAWQWIGYTTKGNAKRALENNFKAGQDC